MFKWTKILMDAADDNGSPSGYGAETTTTATTTETTQTQGDTSNGAKGDASGAGATDDTTAGDDKSKQVTTTESEKGVTGYEAGKEGEKPAEQKPADDKPLELDLKGLSEESVKDIQDIAKAHGLTKEQAQALVDNRKAHEDKIAQAKETYKTEEAKVFQKWETELKSDPEFGGDNFAQSVHNVNKLIREELPGIKNLLTTSGKRLPPSVMKDLNNVARKLYGETELVQGERTSKTESRNPWDFYKKT